MLFLGRVGVGGEGGAQGGLFGLLAHGLVDDGCAFGGNFRSGYLAFAVHPNIDNDDAFFGEVVVGAVQRFRTATAEVVARSVAFSALTVIFLDTRQTIRIALVAGLTRNAF